MTPLLDRNKGKLRKAIFTDFFHHIPFNFYYANFVKLLVICLNCLCLIVKRRLLVWHPKGSVLLLYLWSSVYFHSAQQLLLSVIPDNSIIFFMCFCSLNTIAQIITVTKNNRSFFLTKPLIGY